MMEYYATTRISNDELNKVWKSGDLVDGLSEEKINILLSVGAVIGVRASKKKSQPEPTIHAVSEE